VYKDESLRFCLDDGAALVSEASGAQPTIRINPARTRSAKATEVLPGSRLTPRSQDQSMIPWLVTGAALLLVAVMGIGITILVFANRKSSTSTPNSNGSNVGKNANSTKTPTNVVDLTGTKWTQTSTISQMKEFNFLANGTINGDSGDNWKQNGNSLTMSITNSYAIYQGTISGDRIDYKAHNKVNFDWTGTLYRARSAATP
jgi:hypothetical protein